MPNAIGNISIIYNITKNAKKAMPTFSTKTCPVFTVLNEFVESYTPSWILKALNYGRSFPSFINMSSILNLSTVKRRTCFAYARGSVRPDVLLAHLSALINGILPRIFDGLLTILTWPCLEQWPCCCDYDHLLPDPVI